MRGQRRRDTAPELALRRALHRRGLRYRLHQRPLPGLRRTADIVFRAATTVVDVRGCYWHGCELHRSRPTANGAWWADKLARNVARDRDTEARLRDAGWEVVVVWEHDDPEVMAWIVESTVLMRLRLGPPSAWGDADW